MKDKTTLKIGELAQATGISIEAIRFYESKGLLAARERSAGGYRLYSPDELAKLRFIRRAKMVGFRLEEIKELLELRLHPDEHTCLEVKQYTRHKIEELEQRISELARIKASLQRLHTACCGGDESALNCSILQLLDSGESL
jgi:MerR family Zn(II)-responsive transcriptional regulator of zntA